ncbi:Fic/DOC family protein [Brevibacterium litoralis]|uniref:Fic/DOC family protein n=1 Tax=Brevibacterium litoralis TaxID=3138935 RepID=UPI0032EE9E5A
MSADPHVYPGTEVLRNLLDLRDPRELEHAEYVFTWRRRVEMEDVFEWAGELRTVAMAKGDSTFFGGDFRHAAGHTFGFLNETALLNGEPSDQEFVRDAAELLSRINYMHPFREGNGRTQRAFLDLVAARAGRRLTWRNIGKFDNVRASVRAHRAGNGRPFEWLIEEILAPPMDGMDPFTHDVYRIGGPLS